LSGFDNYIRKTRSKIDGRIASTMTDEMQAITTGGKKLRSLLTITVYNELKQGDSKQDLLMPYDLACCVELIHALTLAADDIIDQDEMRRGKPSLYTLKGFSMAFLEIISGLSVPYSLVSQYGREYIDAVANTQREMCSGVAHEILKDLPASTLYNIIISRKTGSLFSLAARFGAMAAGASDKDIKEMAEFGLRLGNTYQVQDDIQDLVSVIYNEKTRDPITGTEFMLLKCLQVDNLSKQLVQDIIDGSIEPAKAKTLLHDSGILNTLVSIRDSDREQTLDLIKNRSVRLRHYVGHCIPESFL